MKLTISKFEQLKKLKYFPVLLIFFSLFFFSSCDKFNSIPLNIPYSIPFFVSGSGSTYYTGSYCPDAQSTTYQDYEDKIQSLSYVQASLTIDSLSTASLTANVQIQVTDGSGNTLFTYNIDNFTPADYMNKAYVLTLTQNDIIALNTYLNKDLSDNCFQVTIQVSNLNGTQYVGGNLDLVLEADTKL
jgi:hypothetical protein